MIFQLSDDIVFPDPNLADPDGLLAVGGDLKPERLIQAYRLGIFPWYSKGEPILWWSPSPRLVLFPNLFKPNKRLARYIRNTDYTITYDQNFSAVIQNCANYREETWINKEMQTAYTHLFSLGYGHSVECWQKNKIVAGLYGISLGKVFFGESMFTTIDNGSKIAFAALINYLYKNNFKIVDCQVTSMHMKSLGANEIDKVEFNNYLKKYIINTNPDGAWKDDKQQ